MDLLLGLDIGSSSIKGALLDLKTGKKVADAASPGSEMDMISQQPGWAEQEPEDWWLHTRAVLEKLRTAVAGHATGGVTLKAVKAIGITYQMHGLVAVDKELKPLVPSIIWCDSRAVPVGEQAFRALGEDFCLSHYLNSPGNFTLSKLRWVKDNRPDIYEKIHKIMLPGDYIALKLTGIPQTTVSGLSEGIMWDYRSASPAHELFTYHGIDESLISEVVPTFGKQAVITPEAARELGLSEDTVVTYRAGDQPNNAFSLNVLNKGEIATTAGTSGVIYGIAGTPDYDPRSRVNTFVHVNHLPEHPSYGILLCINGTGILNRWLKTVFGINSYEEMNRLAAQVEPGAGGVMTLPFGNGAERVLENRDIGSFFRGVNFNLHQAPHLFRAGQEGIAFTLNYGLEIMRQTGCVSKVIRAGHANMFLSPVFREIFVNTTGAALELYDTDGAQGAARAAGIGLGAWDFREAFSSLKKIRTEEPDPAHSEQYQEIYNNWKTFLERQIQDS